MDATTSKNAPMRELGKVIADNRKAIEERWLARVAADVIREPGVELTRLKNSLPAYLDALVELLSHGQLEALSPTSEEAWSRVAREHGITRVRLGFDITQLVHEFVVLRQVIAEFAREDTIASSIPVLSDVIEEAIAAAVRAYVETRDYDARRKQAEHIGFLTHELRNPLTTAMLSAGQLRETASSRQQSILDRLERAHDRLKRLIDSVLITQKLEAGKLELRPVAFKMREVLEPAIDAARSEAAKKRLQFRVVYDGELEVRLDPTLTQSAISNLVDNAVKYTDRGHVELVLEPRRTDMVLHVRDSCPGLSAEELRTIFEPFERGKFGASRRAGTGLGLTIAKRAVEAQGGSIHAESPAAAGCHFWMTLPLRVGRENEPEAAERRPAP